MLKLTCATIALLALSNPALAICATQTDAIALKTAVLQQELMVAGFQCHEAGAYNRFVLGYRGELQASDAALKAFFVKRGGEHGEAGYDTFKTKAANLSGLEQARDTRAFCADAHALFAAAAANTGSLAQLVDSRSAPLDLGGICKEARPLLAAAEPVARPVAVVTIAKPARLVQVADARPAASDAVLGVPDHARPANVWRREDAHALPPDADDDDMDDYAAPSRAAADQEDLPRPRAMQIRQRSDDAGDDRYGPPSDWRERARRAWREQEMQAYSPPRDRWDPRDGW
ncbi:MAG: hypothetical protein JWN16_182 [Alphaproteobacteria bacterium]|nr:hypothetical protein [Alphaproteobacteria bacterium]